MRNHALLLLWFACGGGSFACGGGETEVPTGSATPAIVSPTGSLGGVSGGKKALPTELNACATASTEAKKTPLFLVFMIDRSLSMFGARLENRWGPCKNAIESFVGSPNAKGISAALSFFPQRDAVGPSCEASSYSTPVVSMTALPSDAFSKSLMTAVPEFGTPMEPAMSGAVAYAQTIAEGEGKGGKVALVLVGDGEPVGCGSDVAGTAKIVGDVADAMPTYVIGLGDASALDRIAAAGKTTKAIPVGGGNGKATEAAFLEALSGIAQSEVACDYAIPAPPEGESFDRGKVNIVHTPTEGGEAETVLYDPDCKANGWRYDDANAPQRVVLCEQSCKAIESKSGKVDVLFGCATRSVGVK